MHWEAATHAAIVSALAAAKPRLHQAGMPAAAAGNATPGAAAQQRAFTKHTCYAKAAGVHCSSVLPYLTLLAQASQPWEPPARPPPLHTLPPLHRLLRSECSRWMLTPACRT